MCNRVQCEMPLLYATKLSSRIILVAQDDLWMTIIILSIPTGSCLSL